MCDTLRCIPPSVQMCASLSLRVCVCSRLVHLEQQSIKSEVVFALFALAKAQPPDATPAHQWSPATHMAKRTIAMQPVLEAYHTAVESHLLPATKDLNATRKTAYLEMVGWTEADMRKRTEAEKEDALVGFFRDCLTNCGQECKDKLDFNTHTPWAIVTSLRALHHDILTKVPSLWAGGAEESCASCVAAVCGVCVCVCG